MRVRMSTRGAGSRSFRRSTSSGTSAAWASAHRVAQSTLRKPCWSLTLGGGVRDGMVQAAGELEARGPCRRSAHERGELGGARERRPRRSTRCAAWPAAGSCRPCGRGCPPARAARSGPRGTSTDTGRPQASACATGAVQPISTAGDRQRGVPGELVEAPARPRRDRVPGRATSATSSGASRSTARRSGCRRRGHQQGADEVGPRLGPAGEVLGHGAGQGGQPGREDGGVVDQPAEEGSFGRSVRARGDGSCGVIDMRGRLLER